MYKSSILIFSTLIAVSLATITCCNQNTLSVSGAGIVQVQPDISVFTVSAQLNGKTSIEALALVNQMIAKANRVLETYGLPTANRTTSGISLNPQYEYRNGASYLVGQQASISLLVTIGNLVKNANIIGRIAKNLSTINGLQISGFNFKNSNTEPGYRQARWAAVADAKSKAVQYASLSGKNLKKVHKIVDQNSEQYIPFVMDANYYDLQSQVLKVPYGKVEVRANVQIDWEL